MNSFPKIGKIESMKILMFTTILLMSFQAKKSFAFDMKYKNLNALSAFLCQSIAPEGKNHTTNKIVIDIQKMGPHKHDKTITISGICRGKINKEELETGTEFLTTFSPKDSTISGSIGLNTFTISIPKNDKPILVKITNPLNSFVINYSLKGSRWASSDSILSSNQTPLILMANGKVVAKEVGSYLVFANNYKHHHIWTYESYGCEAKTPVDSIAQCRPISKERLSSL